MLEYLRALTSYLCKASCQWRQESCSQGSDSNKHSECYRMENVVGQQITVFQNCVTLGCKSCGSKLWKEAKESLTVTSQISPYDQGRRMRLSSHFPSYLDNPDGSKMAGMFALRSDCKKGRGSLRSQGIWHNEIRQLPLWEQNGGTKFVQAE